MPAGQSLINAIPGFSGLSSGSSDLIKQLMSGQLTTGERSSIYNAGAERGIMGGMPGSSAKGGSLYANADLRNIGRASGERQQQGFQDFLSMLQGYSGTVTPTAGQEMQQDQFAKDLELRNKQYGLQERQFESTQPKVRVRDVPDIGSPWWSTKTRQAEESYFPQSGKFSYRYL
jgi:hypothetical protein